MAEKKKYITVKVPVMGSEMRLLGTADELNKKTIKLDLTRKLRGKGLTMRLRILKQNEELVAIPNNLELTASYIRRMMRKRSDYVEDSFQTNCTDIKVTIKPFLITRKKVSRAVRKNLRNTAKEFLLEYVKDKDFIDVCNELISGTIQKTMLPKLKKVYPLSFCDIRVFETGELDKIDMNKATVANEEENIQDSEKEAVQEINEEEAVQEINEEE
jgi:ribosomal protein S3AE